MSSPAMFRPAPFARRSDMLSVPRERVVITEEARPVLPRSVRLHFDSVRGRHVVLSPEKVLWPDEVSMEILKLCDGVRNIEGITDVLAAQYNAPRDVIRAD